MSDASIGYIEPIVTAKGEVIEIKDDYMDDFFLAFLSKDDPILEGLDLSAAQDRVRIMPSADAPEFVVFYQRNLGAIGPYELLDALAGDRIEFVTEDDHLKFSKALTEKLCECYQVLVDRKSFKRFALKVLVVSIAVVGVTAACRIATKHALRNR